MKTRKTASKTKAAAAKDPAMKTKGKVRTRQTGVRGRVLALLADGPLTSSELVAKGGFSAASLYLNMKTLKKEGMVATIRNGRSVSISLVDGAAAGTAAPASSEAPVKSSTKAKAKKTGGKRGRPRTVVAVSGGLNEALAGLTRRLAPVERSQEKMRVLEQLTHSLPAPVAAVLKEIMADLAR